MNHATLDRSLIGGIAWTALFRWSAQAVSWFATFYAVRVLTPGDYGLVAMAMVPIGFARLAEDFGLDSVIVQGRNLTDGELARLGGCAIALGISLALGFAALAPLIAGFFKESAVTPIIAVLGLLLVFDAIQVVPRALLQRDLRFRELALLNGVQYATGAVVLAGAAALGLGYWSLVLNGVLASAVATLVALRMRPSRFAWPGEFKKIAAPIRSAGAVLGARGGWYAYNTLDNTIIGRMLGKELLGSYSFAMTLANLPIQEITALVSRVVPGVFSAVQNDREALKRYFLLLTEAMSYLAFPASIGVALTADHLVRVALGENWGSAAAPLGALCFYMVVNTAQMLASHVLVWTGHFRLNMWFSLLAAVVLPIGFLIGTRWGIAGVGWAWAIGFPIVSTPGLIVAWRIMGLSARDHLGALMPALTSCFVMAIAVVLVDRSLAGHVSALVALLTEASVGAAVYAITLLVAFRSRILALWHLIHAARHA